jgi:hypothetical protein
MTFGFDIAIGDITGDGFGEIVVAAPGSQVGVDGEGALVVLRGTASGVTLAGHQVITENTPGIPGTPVRGEPFGRGGVQVGDVTGDGRPDVLVSCFYESVGTATRAGTVMLLPGTATGAGTSGVRVFDQSSVPGVGGPAADENFGRFVTLVNLDGQGALDALITTGSEQSLGPEGVVTVFGGGSGTLTPFGTVNVDSYLPDFFTVGFGILP